jgi:hypothetical protein
MEENLNSMAGELRKMTGKFECLGGGGGGGGDFWEFKFSRKLTKTRTVSVSHVSFGSGWLFDLSTLGDRKKN